MPPEQAKNYILCNHCNKYCLKKDCKRQDIREVRVETTFTDCGYGDDDKMGEVEYLVTYSICPRCGGKQQTSKLYLRTICEWNRRDGKREAKYYNK